MTQPVIREASDVVVVGGGHAGCEAALACARLGLSTTLVTPNLDRIAWMSCNPSVGGVGKGQLVRELDALGGAMGRIADQVTLHARTLNHSKGPAVRSTRIQADMFAYAQHMAALLDRTPGLILRQGLVEEILVQDGRVAAVRTSFGEEFTARAVVVTTGTFLRALLHVGEVSHAGGRMGEPAASGLSRSLAELGFPLGRLKTGTCPRLDGRSVDVGALERQDPEPSTPLFSVDSATRPLPQLPCYLTHTTAETHALIQDGLARSPLFNGQIAGRGPRYCPSIEDKVVRFPDKQRHSIFIEPEGQDSCEVYLSGLSTSLPADLQLAMVRSLPGCAQARVRRWGYAVEYDFVPPTELWPWLETKRVPGLFLAGQINGTSGYEEAAAQGLVAGINAARHLWQHTPLILGRDQAYIGVMIDDLVTRGTDEPYRMLTSRAEHRLLLREDNVLPRLLELAEETGLLDATQRARRRERVQRRTAVSEALLQRSVAPSPELDAILRACDSAPLTAPGNLAQLCRRPELDLAALRCLAPEFVDDDDVVLLGAVTDLRYQGYLDHARLARAREQDLEQQAIPDALDYLVLGGLSAEMREKLSRIRPRTLAQASRIPGVTHAALSVVAIALLRLERSP
ncbi:MAG: tRNA uridine-5-carboxymethylaminomethyl(34) synthesis enzyme MnmG [Pseudomonadota bacterium]